MLKNLCHQKNKVTKLIVASIIKISQQRKNHLSSLKYKIENNQSKNITINNKHN